MKLVRAITLASVAVVVATIGLAAPAQASIGEGMVKGSDVPTDDWGDEGMISRYSRAYSGATGMWQAVLWADGAIEQDGTTFDAGDIDCEFGPNTQAATRNWQSRNGVGVDGEVGPQTFGKADNKLVLTTWYGGDQFAVEYRGSLHTFRMVRNGTTGVTPGYEYGYWTSSWDYAFFTYNSKPGNCGGVPAAP